MIALIKTTLAALAATLALAGTCDAQTVGLHMATAHEYAGMNGSNPGAYVRLDNGFTVGLYENSVRRTSFYVGYTVNVLGPIDVSFVGITGYQAYPVATIVPSVAIPLRDRLGARLALLLTPDKGAAVHLSMEWRL